MTFAARSCRVRWNPGRTSRWSRLSPATLRPSPPRGMTAAPKPRSSPPRSSFTSRTTHPPRNPHHHGTGAPTGRQGPRRGPSRETPRRAARHPLTGSSGRASSARQSISPGSDQGQITRQSEELPGQGLRGEDTRKPDRTGSVELALQPKSIGQLPRPPKEDTTPGAGLSVDALPPNHLERPSVDEDA